jgi:hypothetical protein
MNKIEDGERIITVQFTVDGIILATRKPTRADLPKSEVEKFKLAAKEFQELYQFEYGVDLTDAEASKKAIGLLQFFNVLTSDESEILT